MKKALQKQGLFHDAEQDFMLWLLEVANFDYKISTFPTSDIKSIPAQRPASLILRHAGLKEVLLLLQVNHLAHPREGVVHTREQLVQTNLLHATVGDKTQVFLEHAGVQAQHATRHGVFGVGVFQLHRLLEQLDDFGLEAVGPQLRVFQLDGVDQVDAEIAVAGLVTQDVLVLLGSAGHLVLTAEGEDLHKADVEEQTFHDAGKHDQRTQQFLVVFQGAGLEGRVAQHVDKRNQEFVLVTDGFDFVVGVEHFALVQAQAFHDVLVGVGVDGFVKSLAQQVLAAFRAGDLAVGAQHDVVGGQAVGGDEEAQVALDDAHFVFGQLAGFPLFDVALHVHFLRHPVVGTLGEVFFPGPFVLERDQLVDVGGAVDDFFVDGIDAAAGVLVVAGGNGRFLYRGIVKAQHVLHSPCLFAGHALWGGRLDLVSGAGQGMRAGAAVGLTGGLFQLHGALAHDADGGTGGGRRVAQRLRQVDQYQAQLAVAVLFRMLRGAAGAAEEGGTHAVLPVCWFGLPKPAAASRLEKSVRLIGPDGCVLQTVPGRRCAIRRFPVSGGSRWRTSTARPGGGGRSSVP